MVRTKTRVSPQYPYVTPSIVLIQACRPQPWGQSSRARMPQAAAWGARPPAPPWDVPQTTTELPEGKKATAYLCPDGIRYWSSCAAAQASLPYFDLVAERGW